MLLYFYGNLFKIMKYIYLVLVIFIFVGCKKEEKLAPRTINSVEVNTLLEDSLLNVRAIELDEKNALGFAASNGDFGGNLFFGSKEEVSIRTKIQKDSIIPNFRSLAIPNNETGFVLGIGSPALLYKITIDSIKLVYQENHPKAFYDAMDFWNDQEGIAIGDVTDDCLSIIITRDGGDTWTKLSCDDLPKAVENEGAFAASDTNIAIVGDKTWVASTAGRVYYSEDKGKTWKFYMTPIVNEEDSDGIYSIDFYDELNGFAIGGDYTKPEENVTNKIRTQDGGKTWEVVGANQEPGYRSCVQYIPNSAGQELVAIGFKGIDYSNDAGNTWKHLSDEGFYTIRFLNDSVAYAAGNGRISKLTFKE